MFRAATENKKLKGVSTANGNINTVVLSTKLKLEEGDYVIRLSPGDLKAEVKDPVYYPVKFVDGKMMDASTMDLPMNLFTHFQYTRSDEYPVKLERLKSLRKDNAADIWFTVQRTIPALARPTGIDREEFIKSFRNAFADYPLCSGQLLTLIIDNVKYEITVDSAGLDNGAALYALTPETKITASMSPSCKNFYFKEKILNEELPLDLSQYDVGGYEEQRKALMQQVFYPLAHPAVAQKLGVKRPTGVLLYGPPGTGKTSFVKAFSKAFKNYTIKVINGPEIFDKMVGGSEKNIRDLWEDAPENRANDPDDERLHIIFFDEFDAIGVRRGVRSDNTGVRDSVVNQLCTLMDGFNEQKNVLVVAATNRPELIDPALLRKGRFDIQIEIGLPTEKDRYEVLKIHTRKMRENGYLSEEVDLREWAKVTRDFSCAELAALVSEAGKAFMDILFEPSADKKVLRKKSEMEIDKSKKVTNEDFARAFALITPAFGLDKARFDFDKEKFAFYHATINAAIESFKADVKSVFESRNQSKLKVLIAGSKGTGKTELAKLMAVTSGATNIRVIKAADLTDLSPDARIRLIKEEFNHALQTESSAVILDGLDDIIKSDYTREALRISLDALLGENKKSSHKCVVIATARDTEELEKTNLLSSFSACYPLQNVRIQNCKTAAEILKPICRSLGFKYVTEGNTDIQVNIDLPIGELTQKIDAFCVNHEGKFYLERFCQFLKAQTSSPRAQAEFARMFHSKPDPVVKGASPSPASASDKVHFAQ